MPDAWGGDEYIGAEWSDTNRGRPPMHWGGENLDAAALGQAAAAAVVQGVVGGTTSSGGGGDPGGGNGLPPPPGEGYQPATVHGQFVGYYSPEEWRSRRPTSRRPLNNSSTPDATWAAPRMLASFWKTKWADPRAAEPYRATNRRLELQARLPLGSRAFLLAC
ncbi:MAG: hypothetical protein IPM93_24015 [Candidatus Obscuribacter sp.]|nr:hypothetical protein [Candidatus Obscuribacter sp.]